MAFYDLECSQCKKKFTIEQSMSDPLPKDCPKCKGKNTLRQIYHAAPVVFHGKGFYCTDCKK